MTAGRLRRLPVGRTTVLLLVVVVGVVLAAGLRTGPAQTTGAAGDPIPAPAPALNGNTLDGGRFDLTEARGQVVLVNVFASWCGPCRDELPLLADTARRWSPHGLRVVGLNLRDGPEAVRALLAETGTTEITVLPDPDGTQAVRWGVRGVPETFVVDRDGRIVARQQGVVTRQWLDQRVAPLLEPA
ncbi:TlpA disulfide reductase family protein [Micromonospora sp. NPDC005367]|uniref:TlpA family protein disulfide reductase n=1 Tax=Micromonospora sp. NPDC005367 TaxID=3155590 RepID=UPI00339FA768